MANSFWLVEIKSPFKQLAERFAYHAMVFAYFGVMWAVMFNVFRFVTGFPR